MLDVCCGPATLYRRELREKGVTYRGLDLNPRFVGRLRTLGIRADVWDASEAAALPPAEKVYVLEGRRAPACVSAGPLIFTSSRDLRSAETPEGVTDES